MGTAAGDLSPLDEQLELRHDSVSPLLARDAVGLSSLLPYEQAEQVLARMGGYGVAATTLWEHRQQVGQRWGAQQQQLYVGVEGTRWERPHYPAHLRPSVGMDGGRVQVRGEGWKELKVGVVGSLPAPGEVTESDTLCSHDLPYTAVLGGVEAFSAALWQVAVQQPVPYAGQVAVTADGAAWIWRLATNLFPCSTQFVDWYHASAQLSVLAQARFPHEPQAALTWGEPLRRHLWQGAGWQVIAQAQALGLQGQTDYFEEHQRRMDYPAFRAEGYPIGSGCTESGVKQFKQRLCGAGMRCSRTGVQRMILLRSALMEDSFDRRWAAA